MQRTKPFSNISIDRIYWFGATILVLTCLISFLWQFVTPLFSDDLVYLKVFNFRENKDYWLATGEKFSNFEQIVDSIKGHFMYVNGRLANLTYISLQLCPVWFIKFVTATFMLLFALSLWQWGGKKSLGNNLTSVLIALLFWVTLQWNDQMQSSDFQFNYVISSWMMVVLMIYFIKRQSRPHPGMWVLLALFSLWHEGFDVVLGSMFLVFWIATKRRYLFVAGCVLLVGLILQSLSASGNRPALYAGEFAVNLRESCIMLVKSVGSIVALVWWMVRRRKVSSDVRKFLDIYVVGFLLSWIVILGLFVFMNGIPQRAHWPNDVLAILLIIMLANTYREVRFGKILGIGLIALYLAWGVNLVIRQVQVTRLYNLVYENVKTGNYIISDKEDYYNVAQPFWLMQIPHFMYGSFHPIETCLHARYVSGCINDNCYTAYLLQPSENEEKTFEELPDIEGDNDFKVYNKNVFIRKSDDNSLMWRKVKLTGDTPDISMTPYSWILALVKGKGASRVEEEVTVVYTPKILLGSDTVEFVMFGSYPLSLRGMTIRSIDILD